MTGSFISIDNDIFHRDISKLMGTKNCQSVEPSSSLIQTFSDEVRRKPVVEGFSVLKGIVSGCVWHASRLEPTIKDLIDTSKVATALLARDGNVIDFIAMQVSYFAFVAAQLLQFLRTAYAYNFGKVLICPKWNWGSPISISRDYPIPRISDPIAKSFFLDVSGDPM